MSISHTPPVKASAACSFLTRSSVHVLLIVLIGLLAYSNTFHVPFTFDDELSIVNNSVIKDLSTFLSGDGYNYNPRRFIGYLSVALNYQLGGADVTGYHAFNLAVHIASACLVYALLRLTLRTPFFRSRTSSGTGDADSFSGYLIPLFAGLLFVAHPIQTQAVTYVIQRLASLAALFFLLSLVCYVRARLAVPPPLAGRGQGAGEAANGGVHGTLPPSPPLPRKGGGRVQAVFFYLLAAVSAGLAMKTKEIAFTLPFVIVMYEFMFFRLSLRKWLVLLAPLLLLLLVVPISILGAGKPIGELLSDVSEKTRVQTDIPRLDYLLTQFRVLVTYLRLLVFPAHQNLDYDYPVYHSLFTPPVFCSFLLLLALLVAAAWLWRKSRDGEQGARELRLISFGILWFFITISVESSLIPIEDVIFEHRVYLPSVGLFLAVATLAASLQRRVSPRVVSVAACAIVLVLAGTTFARNLTWQSEERLWADTAAKSPGKPRPHYNLALALQRTDDGVGLALREANIAARLAPQEPKLLNLLGCLYGRTGRYDEAIAAFSASIKLDPDAAEPHTNLGDVFRRERAYDRALEQYVASLKLAPTNAGIYDKIGMTYGLSGNMEKAAEFHQCAVNLDPGRPEYRLNLAQALAFRSRTRQ